MSVIPESESKLLARIARIDKAERTMLAKAVLGPNPQPDSPLAPLLASMLLLHDAATILQQAERKRLKDLIGAIAESDAIRDHERGNGAIRYDSTSK
jgi:hypothetical protein